MFVPVAVLPVDPADQLRDQILFFVGHVIVAHRIHIYDDIQFRGLRHSHGRSLAFEQYPFLRNIRRDHCPRLPLLHLQGTALQKIKFSYEISVGGEVTGTYNANVVVFDYDLQKGAVAVINDDNGDGLLNPGETADLRIMVDNAGNELAQSVMGTLSTDYELVTLNGNQKSFSTIGAELMGYADFNVVLDANAPEDFAIPFTLDLVDANGRHTILNFNYKNSCNVIFSLHDYYGDGWQGNYPFRPGFYRNIP